jgi:hypothetical protein
MEQQKVTPQQNAKPGAKSMFDSIKKFFRPRAAGVFVGRKRTRDISFLAQSPSGVIGAVVGMVPPASIDSFMNDLTNPVTSFGLACLGTSTNTVRSLLTTDTAITNIFGITVKPNTFQASTATGYGAVPFSALTLAPYGAGFAPLGVLKSGEITVYVNTAQAATAAINTPVYAYVGATTGTHVQGGFETAPLATVASAPGTNTGNGTMGTLSVNPVTAVPGIYTVKFTAPTVFSVFDPTGKELLGGTTGTAYSDEGVTFTITAGGTAFAAGDSFTVTTTFTTVALPSTSYFAGPGDAATGATNLFFNI